MTISINMEFFCGIDDSDALLVKSEDDNIIAYYSLEEVLFYN